MHLSNPREGRRTITTGTDSFSPGPNHFVGCRSFRDDDVSISVVINLNPGIGVVSEDCRGVYRLTSTTVVATDPTGLTTEGSSRGASLTTS